MLPPFLPKPIKARSTQLPIVRKAKALVENALKAPLRVLGVNVNKSDLRNLASHTRGTS